MDRRKFLAGAAGAAGAVASGILPLRPAFAGSSKRRLKTSLLVTDSATLKQLVTVRERAFECVSAALACQQHCHEQLLEGNAAEFQYCSLSVQQMIPFCEAVGTLAGLKAVRIGEMLDACINACRECEKACNEHKDHFAHGMHMECKACLESCRRCIEACERLKKLL